MDWGTIATILVGIGGLDFLKWAFNRKSYARKESAAAEDAEQTLHDKQLERYEKRLSERDAKVDAIYKEYRASQKREIELTEENGRLKLEIKLLEYQKCEVRGCADRKPPGVY